jgi:hypothetical protein
MDRRPPNVMAGHVSAIRRDRLSLRLAGTCPAMTVEQHAWHFHPIVVPRARAQ